MKHKKILTILTLLLALSLAVVSIAGAFFPDTYARDSASMATQGIGQDLVDLFVGAPCSFSPFTLPQEGTGYSHWFTEGPFSISSIPLLSIVSESISTSISSSTA